MRYVMRLVAILCLLHSHALMAKPRMAVLDFELNDITSLPNTPDEIKRTAVFRGLVEQQLRDGDHYELVAIDSAAQAAANQAFGYLFRFDDAAADLAQQAAVDWLIVGQHSKPSFLFSYLIVHLIDVKSKKSVEQFDIELKGTDPKVSEHAVKALVKRIKLSISKHAPSF